MFLRVGVTKYRNLHGFSEGARSAALPDHKMEEIPGTRPTPSEPLQLALFGEYPPFLRPSYRGVTGVEFLANSTAGYIGSTMVDPV